MNRGVLVILAMCGACDGGQLPVAMGPVLETGDRDVAPLSDYDLEPGTQLQVAAFDVPEGAVLHVQVDTLNVEATPLGDPNLAVGVSCPGTATAWLVGYVPFAASSKPLASGRYSLGVGCAEGATHHCVFTFAGRLQ